MAGNNAVKSTAKTALNRFWGEAVAIAAIISALAFAGFYVVYQFGYIMKRYAFVPAVLFSALFFVMAFSPVLLGALRYFWRATGGTVDKISSLFFYFEKKEQYLRCVMFTLMLLLRTVIAGLVILLPYFLTVLFTYLPSIGLSTHLEQLWILGRFLLLFGGVLLFAVMLRFYISPLLFVSRDDINWTEALYMSKQISRQTSGSFVILILGFAGWIVLSVLGITMLYTLPYMLAAYAVHGRYAINFYNHYIRVSSGTDFPRYRSTF